MIHYACTTGPEGGVSRQDGPPVGDPVAPGTEPLAILRDLAAILVIAHEDGFTHGSLELADLHLDVGVLRVGGFRQGGDPSLDVGALPALARALFDLVPAPVLEALAAPSLVEVWHALRALDEPTRSLPHPGQAGSPTATWEAPEPWLEPTEHPAPAAPASAWVGFIASTVALALASGALGAATAYTWGVGRVP